jgi:hypothetical protein
MSFRKRALATLCCTFAVGVAPAPAAAADPAAVDWSQDWPRFRPVEVAVTAVLTAHIASVLLLYPDPKPNWENGILFDDAVRDGLRLGRKRARDDAARASDYIDYALALYPMLVDTALVTDLAHGKQDVALQMFAMNFESYALSGALSLSLEQIGRARPLAAECAKDRNYSRRCSNQGNMNASFPSTSTAIAFTSAGLTCAHHQHLPLYGGGAPDLLACLVGLAAATSSGVLKLSSDANYTSDVIVGSAIGLFSGYGLPSLLHYGFTSGKQSSATSVLPTFRSTALGSPLSAVLAPRVDSTGAGVSLTGSF